MIQPTHTFPPEILEFYDHGQEASRLARGIGPLEYVRTQEIIQRYFPAPPAQVFDIGGGPGAYSLWLARLGYTVHLVDRSPLHVQQSRGGSFNQADHPLSGIILGDGRCLPYPANCADAILLHGPLYHLVEKIDRLAALQEARRILRPYGVLLAVMISCYASSLVGLVRGWLDDPDFFAMCVQELASGKHIPPASWPGLFTTAYFHHPGELESEVQTAGLIMETTLAVQGPGWLARDFEQAWQNEQRRETILALVRRMESEAGALGMSPHNIVVARKSIK